MTDDKWQDRGACKGQPATVMYDDAWDDDAQAPGPLLAEALDFCRSCDVRQQCLDAGLDGNEEFGLWGGSTPADRRRVRRQKMTRAQAHAHVDWQIGA